MCAGNNTLPGAAADFHADAHHIRANDHPRSLRLLLYDHQQRADYDHSESNELHGRLPVAMERQRLGWKLQHLLDKLPMQPAGF